jgi:hypothetical protein
MYQDGCRKQLFSATLTLHGPSSESVLSNTGNSNLLSFLLLIFCYSSTIKKTQAQCAIFKIHLECITWASIRCMDGEQTRRYMPYQAKSGDPLTDILTDLLAILSLLDNTHNPAISHLTSLTHSH